MCCHGHMMAMNNERERVVSANTHLHDFMHGKVECMDCMGLQRRSLLGKGK